MKILWDKKLIKLSNGSYIAWGLKRKKFFFANKNELKLNCTIIEYYEEREKCEEKVNSDLKKIIAELEAQIEKMKYCGNCKNYSPTYGLCCYSLGDEDYDCRLRKWEIKEND